MSHLNVRKLLASLALIGLPMYSFVGLPNGQPAIQTVTALASAANAAPAVAEAELERKAREFARELAAQPPFAQWSEAELAISALGPGTHGWLVLVKSQKKIVGYMVLHATETGGYQLGEYGIGGQPLFSLESLQFSKLKLALPKPADKVERIYVHPLLAAWKHTSGESVYYTDAASGEELPVNDMSWDAAAKAEYAETKFIGMQTDTVHKLQKSQSLPSFNPFAKLPWLTDAPLEIDPVKYSSLLIRINAKEQLRYVAERFDDEMLYAWSVVGYHNWSGGQAYIALEAQEESGLRRFIPLQLLLGLGSFYR